MKTSTVIMVVLVLVLISGMSQGSSSSPSVPYYVADPNNPNASPPPSSPPTASNGTPYYLGRPGVQAGAQGWSYGGGYQPS